MTKETNSVVMAFTEEQVSNLTNISGRQLKHWDRTGFFVPTFAHDDRRQPLSRLYSFRDLVCLKVISALRNEANVPLQHLREVKEKLSHLGSDMWAKTTLFVLNRRVVFVSPETNAKEEIVSGQGILQIPLKIVTGDMKKAAEELRKRDISLTGQIERKKNIAGNRPVIAGTRIPVSSIKAFAKEGYSINEIQREFPTLTEADIAAAITYEGAA